ncbi:MAG: dihydrofolate reductase family protein [bacterium]|nr:dihydrofolate reductase family protein [bacterium]
MRKVVYFLNMSLDGFIEDANGSLDWSSPDEELHRFFNEQEREFDFQLYGRRIYETMAAHWTTAHTDPSAPAYEIEYARIWQSIPKIVFSKTLEKVGANARLVRENIADEVRALKAQPGKDMVVCCAGLAASFMQLDLIDEYRPMIHPVVLGGGKPMFPALDKMIGLQLIETRRFGSGVVLLRYQRTEQPS